MKAFGILRFLPRENSFSILPEKRTRTPRICAAVPAALSGNFWRSSAYQAI